MNKQTTKKDGNEPVTKKEFNERFDTVDDKFKKIDVRFDKIELALQNQAKATLRNTDDITIIKETMATKDDIHKILTAIDSFAQKSVVWCLINSFTFEGSDLSRFMANDDEGIPSVVC